ncbi:Fur-regulated basic protein FbpA [Neobacillus sp. DY30]|uniref:Fur-regulated basic protein FbpA n=1 Tax=Neobacillus sp. DY30 TaxID=3047871 RepID=UPI0024C0A558|nr:Fur-regulated basic protein FbpA [Neobacillus sp. DY30]WHY01602.1 Fur-regulated basic protein FbpA [Neobacillus sp. DY30]
MTNQLRKGVETLKLFYINRLIESGLYNASDDDLYSLTLSELQIIFKKTFPQKNTLNTEST